MGLYVSHTTALACLRALAAAGESLPYAEVRNINDYRDIPDQGPSVIRQIVPREAVLHILAPNDEPRLRRPGLICHSFMPDVPEGAFLEICDGVYLSSPELCFLQMAPRVPLPVLVQIGYELCGRYVLNGESNRGFTQTRVPLTNLVALRRFLLHAQGAYGSHKALSALRYIAENSWSPMETDTTILLTMPTQMGGYGFALPLLNTRIDLKGELRRRVKHDHYYLDLHWVGTHVALEYHGLPDHTGSASVGNDRIREVVLTQLGYRYLVVTGRQVLNASEFDLVAKTLCALLGRRYRKPTAVQMQHKIDFRASLFSAWDPIRSSRKVFSRLG